MGEKGCGLRWLFQSHIQVGICESWEREGDCIWYTRARYMADGSVGGWQRERCTSSRIDVFCGCAVVTDCRLNLVQRFGRVRGSERRAESVGGSGRRGVQGVQLTRKS